MGGINGMGGHRADASCGFAYTVTTAALPRPKFCCRATRAPSTCRFCAAPLSCQHSSAHCAMPVAPMGWPLLSSPPLGLTTHLPPIWKSSPPARFLTHTPLSMRFFPSPSAHRPTASQIISSLLAKQSCTSSTSTSAGVKWASSSACLAAFAVMSKPQREKMLVEPFSKVEGKSVTIDWPKISIACASRLYARTKRSLHTIAAAAPSPVGHAMSKDKGPYSGRALRITSYGTSRCHAAYGLCTECLWFLCAILAKCSRVVPNRLMCSLAASPNIRMTPAVIRFRPASESALFDGGIISKCRSTGLV
mmetsp:Transcript_25083/g.63046  ORF Transcript_25083/g.63046 Transcript_25083/m.63046 type:complete len:306 (+) Transcript_25083:213-1130(+)